MNRQTPACPTCDDLQRLNSGELTDQEAEQVVAHLDDCAGCLNQILSLTDSGLLAEVIRGPLRNFAFAREAGYERALAAIRRPQQVVVVKPKTYDELANLFATRGYRLVDELDRGSTGTVYRAQQTKLDRAVAIKVLAAERVADPRVVARFEREMRAVGQFDHPNIVRAIDAAEEDGVHYLVMEYLRGINLSQLLAVERTLAVAEACELVRQICLGLEETHAKGIVHRDIKPSNLMISSSAQGRVVAKIIDFELALPTDQKLTVPLEEHTNYVVGTVAYMAPEQWADSHRVDGRADIYSLAAIFHQTLGGVAPFPLRRYPTLGRTAPAALADTSVPVHELRADCPPQLSWLIARCLDENPNNRPPTALDFAQQLEVFSQAADMSALSQRIESSFALNNSARAKTSRH